MPTTKKENCEKLHNLKSSNRAMEIDEHEMAEMAAYNSAFHAARALLFANGYTERSHFCLGVADGAFSIQVIRETSGSSKNSWISLY